MKRTTTSLRKRAEAKVRERKKARRKPPKKVVDTASRLVHELEVHQVELELQNEELRTSRQATEEALERYTEVFDFAPVGYTTLDSERRILEINHAGARMLGHERSTFVGEPFEAFVAPENRGAFNDLVATTSTRGAPASTELDLRDGDANVPVRMTCAVLRRAQTTLLLAFEDVSERRAKEIALARSEQALREMNRRKDEFLAMLSHELRNPLSPIRTSIEVLRLAEPGSDASQSSIDIIDRAATHMTRLVDDLLDVTRITRGKVELRREPLDLISLVAHAIEDHRAAMTQRRLLVETSYSEPRIWMVGDGARIAQVLSNVLANAEKFTPSGGKIRVSVSRTGDMAAISVKDSGVGIAPETVAELFEPFAQAPQSLDRHRGGLGLGLTMVKALVELHGGRVSVRSSGLGKGTEVVITLPVDTSYVARDVAERPRAARRRVLVVEDMRDTATSLQRALQLRGHEVVVAYTGKEGLDLALSFRPDVVFCDLGLPDIDGYAFAMHVRTHATLVPYLVALSGYARPEDVARAIAAGFDRHVAKPAPLDELDRVLANAPPPTPGSHEQNTLH